MRELTPEQMGLNCEALLKLIGPDKALDLIGLKQTVKHFGLKALLEAAKEQTDQEVREGLEGKSQPPSGPDQSAPAQN